MRTAVALAGIFFIGMIFLAGCAVPSRARYAELLHECRELNREHLRLLKTYEATECAAHPEQLHGAAEMGLGGW
jgi:hypothetical protein